jgi:hypothetical protein
VQSERKHLAFRLHSFIPLHIIRRFTQYWRNDYVAVEQFSRSIVRGHYVALLELHRQHQQFALQWDTNLRMQGFLEAFSDKSIRG